MCVCVYVCVCVLSMLAYVCVLVYVCGFVCVCSRVRAYVRVLVCVSASLLSGFWTLPMWKHAGTQALDAGGKPSTLVTAGGHVELP